MKNIFLIGAFTLLLVLSSNLSNGQTWQWGRSSAGSVGGNAGYRVATDNEGNVYMTGYYVSSYIVFGADTLEDAGNGDLFLVKYDASGNLIWTRWAGGTGVDMPEGITLDKKGNIYLTGGSHSPYIVFGNDTVWKVTAGIGVAWTVKYNANGNVIWAKGIRGTGGCDAGEGVAVDKTGNVYVTGNYWDSAVYFGNDTLLCVTPGAQDVFVVKYDSAGNEVWGKTAGSVSVDLAGGIAFDSLGYIYITGQYGTPYIPFGKDTLTDNYSGTSCTFVVKYDLSGTVIWAKSGTGVKGSAGVGIEVGDNHSIYVGGNYFGSSIVFGKDSLTTNSGNLGEAYLIKFDTTGYMVWGAQSGNGANVLCAGIAVDGIGDEYITGHYSNAAIFGSDTLTTTATGEPMYIAEFDLNGNPLAAYTCTKSFGTPSSDGYGVAANTTGDVYVAGDFGTKVIFGSDTLSTSGSGHDVYVAKLSHTTDGIQPVKNWDKIVIYPNPSPGTFTIQLPSAGSKSSVEIYDVLGEKVYSELSVVTDKLSINLSNQPSGIYLYRVLNENRDLLGEGKVVIQK